MALCYWAARRAAGAPARLADPVAAKASPGWAQRQRPHLRCRLPHLAGQKMAPTYAPLGLVQGLEVFQQERERLLWVGPERCWKTEVHLGGHCRCSERALDRTAHCCLHVGILLDPACTRFLILQASYMRTWFRRVGQNE